MIPLQTRLRYTTMIVLPDGEEILDVICGDKDFWVISADAEHRAREAREGGRRDEPEPRDGAAATIYSFLLTEKNGAATPDLKVYVNADPNAPTGEAEVLQRRAGRGVCRRELTEARGGVEAAERRATRDDRGVPAAVPGAAAVRLRRAEVREAVPRPAIWHDGQFTYLKADATELPALYEVKDGKPALVNFQVQRRHVRRAEGPGARLSGARQRSASRSSSRER